MRQKLVRIHSIDEIEQPGILYCPNEDTKRIVIHVHGLYGNFYENGFLDILAKTYTDRGYAFLTFNNRGVGAISELSKGDEFAIIGACFERFQDCILDLEGIINWVKQEGYNEIVLEAHSYGCNKALYYYMKKKHPSIKQIVLLAPCDIPAECRKFLSKEEYQVAKEESTRLVNEGKENELVDFPVLPNRKISAGTYYHDFLPGGEDDFIRYSDEKSKKNEILNHIDIPVLVVFGDIDECVLTEPIEVVEDYLQSNISNCKIEIIPGADHSYTNKYNELGKVIFQNF